MGSTESLPSESNMGDRLRCCKCNKVLPPCKSFRDLYCATVNGKYVYVFNRGEYYRPYNVFLHECAYCFHKPVREEKMRLEEKKREEERRREEERLRKEEERRREEERQRKEEERRREEERQRKEEERRREEKRKKADSRLNQRLQETQQHLKERHEKQLSSSILGKHEYKQNVLRRHLDKLENEYDSDSFSDQLLEFLSLKSNIEVSDLSLIYLSADRLGKILSALDTLLFDEWISAPPSLCTLQHAQVYITELCVLSLETSEEDSLESICSHVHSLVESISQSAFNVSESFMLTQALYLTLMHFLNDSQKSDSDAVLIAKQWAEGELCTEHLFATEILSLLISSLDDVVDRYYMLVFNIETQCLKLLLSTLALLIGKETHSESSETILKLVDTHRWTPMEALTLLKVLSQKCTNDASIRGVLMMIQVYDISPEWTDESGRSITQVFDLVDPKRFCEDFQISLRNIDRSRLLAALEEIKISHNLDGHMVDMIKDITTEVLQYSQNEKKVATLKKDCLKYEAVNAAYLQKTLSQLCTAVFDTKGWWPTVKHMLQWCVLMVKEQTGEPLLFGVEDEPCAIAMFAATHASSGNKMNIVLSSVGQAEEQTNQWSAFYKNLGFAVNTNTRRDITSLQDVYKADIVYGTLDTFVFDYFESSMNWMETDFPELNRGYIIEQQCLSSFHNLELSRLEDKDSLKFAARVLNNLMCKVQSKDGALKQSFLKAFLKLLHMNQNNDSKTESNITNILRKMSAKRLAPNQIFIFTFLENLQTEAEREAERSMTSPPDKWYLEVLFACAEELLELKKEAKDIFEMALNLELWSPAETLNLLGSLTSHHFDEGCISIMKILHLVATYQVSSKWTNESNQSLIQLLGSKRADSLIEQLEKSLRDEKVKDIDTLVDEIRQMNDTDEQTLRKTHSVVSQVTKLIETGEIAKHNNAKQARHLSHSLETESLQELLAVLCNAVHLCIAGGRWWPRTTQMISWCLLALSENGKLLEMGTGEGKSCVIAMFAALRVLRGEKVDVISTSSVLCERDAEEWREFYKYFGITVDTNTNKTDDKKRKGCYQKDIVYGTIETFAADHLRQVFEMKDVRPDRCYQCIIIDEVDSLLLDQGVQLTYLSTPMVSMQHLNTILAMIWGHVCQYGYLSSGQQVFVQGPPASFFKVVFDSINTDESEINDPMDILYIAEETNTVPEGFTEDIYKSENNEILQKLETVNQDAVVDFLGEMESYVPYGFTVYTLDDDGLLCLKKRSSYNKLNIPELKFLVLENGLCCPLYDSEDILIEPIAELISDKIQYTPCKNNDNKISIPGFLKNLIEKKMSTWVQNAFLATKLREGQDYVVENDNICPVDFRSTGVVELNKKWGDGLQQFVEIKHQIKLSTISAVTNYISNVSFFKKYQGKMYGTTGTLGSKADILCLQDLYPNLSALKMPTFNRKKLFEVKGIVKESSQEWISEINRMVMDQISPNTYRDGRAALVICETINRAKEIYEDLKGKIPGDIILYCRSDKDSLSKIEKKLCPGDVVVATNLAGRGTNIKVSKGVNNNGGLFVILSFLSENTRVELQAFGRTARKGEPGSAQIVMCTEHVQQDFFMTMSSLGEAKSERDRIAAEKISHMMNDVTEMKLREDLFSQYCKTLQDIHRNTDGDERRAVVAILNEFWGIWLQTKSKQIEQLERDELQESLKTDLAMAKSQSQSQTSPCSSIYHYIKFGNLAVEEEQYDLGTRLFEKAMIQDESWAAVAFYSHAYCTIKRQKADYLDKAREDLQKAQESLKYLTEEPMACLQFIKMASANYANNKSSSLEKLLTTRCYMYRLFGENIKEAIQKIDEIKEKGRDALAQKSTVFSLFSNADEELQTEACNLYSQGLKYVFAVEEKPRFSWGGLVVFFLGLLQIVAGTLVTVFTCGWLAQVGVGLITEGVSDCIYGIEAMVTGEFSWKSWAIQKSISIAVSVVAFGIGKLIAKGFRACKTLIKGLGKKLKALPKFFSRQAKDGMSVVAKANLKNAVKHTTKKVVEEIICYGLGKAEEEILKTILNKIKNEVQKGIADDVKSNLAKEPIATLVDSIILSHLEEKHQLKDLLSDRIRRSDLLDVFRHFSHIAMQPFYADLEWQNKLNSSLIRITDAAKAGAKAGGKGKMHVILSSIQTVHYLTLAGDATATALTLSSKFFNNFQEELNTFKKEKGFSEKVMVNELSASDTEVLEEFKQELNEAIRGLLADALVEVFHQKFSSHLVSRVQGEVNGYLLKHVRTGLRSDRTEEKLRAGQNNRYITNMPVNLNSKSSGDAGEHSKSHAEKIRNLDTKGTIFDVRVLSEATGTKAVILIEDKRGRLRKMQEINPSSKPTNQTVELIYRPKSSQYPDGHYDVHIDNKIVIVDGNRNSCMFHAFAHGLRPNANQERIAVEAENLRLLEAKTLLRHPGHWDPFIKRKLWTDTIRGGDWYMAEGATGRKLTKQEKETCLNKVGGVGKYKIMQKDQRKRKMGKYLHADHEPPVSCIVDAVSSNREVSQLAKAMAEVATNTSSPNADQILKVKKSHGRELPSVFVPDEIHAEFPSTKSPAFRRALTERIISGDVEGTFKLTILGSIPRCKLVSNKGFKDFQEDNNSKFKLDVFERSFPQHSEAMLDHWSSKLQSKGVMTSEHLENIRSWIKNKGYKDQNDRYRKEVAELL